MKIVWGLLALWVLPIAAVASLVNIAVPLFGSIVAGILAIYAWSAILLVALLPSEPRRLARGLSAIAFVG